jgi:hypothetical protein
MNTRRENLTAGQEVERGTSGNSRVKSVTRVQRASVLDGRAAFTMIEIAIALAVIGFALVAIIGILPRGLNVQQENREETIINQDGPYLLEAIRGGVRGLGVLSNCVDAVGVVVGDTNGVIRTNYICFTNNPTAENFVMLMSQPRGAQSQCEPGWFVLRTEAKMRALTGAALEQGTNHSEIAFSYLVTAEVVPYFGISQTLSNDFYFADPNSAPAQIAKFEQTMGENFHELRLRFAWPLLPGSKYDDPPRVGPKRQIFRSFIGGAQNTNLVFQQQVYHKQ